jgi:hypothetical protein
MNNDRDTGAFLEFGFLVTMLPRHYMDERPARSESEEIRTAIRVGYEVSMK